MRLKKALKGLAKSGHLGVIAQIASGRVPGAVGNIFHDGYMDGVNDYDSTYGFNPPPKKKPPIKKLPYRY